MPISNKRVLILRCSIFILLWASMPAQLWAQYNMPQNNVWAFAGGEGVNFSGGSGPVSITTSSVTQEGSASVSDNSGNLLFYTGGTYTTIGARVYNRTGALMPNGSAIVPFATYSCTQAAAIVPVIGNHNQYYVFSLEQGGSSGWGGVVGFCRLYYCIVDMTLNGGLGDVIASTIATPLDSGLCEKMTVVAGNNCDIWLVAHAKDAPVFKAYNISSTGISAAVVSSATGEIPIGTNAYKIGTIKVSPDRTMISNCVVNGAYAGGGDRLELLRFNAATGIVSGCQVLNNFTNQYDADFSPDNSKLYARVMGSRVYQYDLSLLPDIAAVIASQFLVYTSPNWGGQMKLGPNGKMYLQTGAGYLDCINSPNLSGSLCSYAYHAIYLGSASTSYLGMPNMQIAANVDTITTHIDTLVCALASTISLNAPYVSAWYIWSNGATTPSVTVSSNGIYWVKSEHGCNVEIDTFNVSNTPAALIPTETPASFCTGTSVILIAPTIYTAHVWNTGEITSSVTANTAGIYWVADTNLSTCSLQTDTFHVMAIPLTLIPTTTPASFCTGASIALVAPTTYTAYVWNTGATTPSVTATAAGTYWVADTNLSTCSLQVDTFYVAVTPFTLIPVETNADFCSGASAVLMAPTGYILYVWNTGATTPSIAVGIAGTYWVTDTNLATCTTMTDTFHVTATLPTITPMVSTASFCAGGSISLVAPTSYTAHVWNTGGATSSLTATAAGTYWVADTIFSSCSLYTDTFHVTTTPPAVIPTGTSSFFCSGATVTLTAPASYTAHVWSTGATTPSVTETTTGTYWVADTNFSTCRLYTDTFHITAITPAIIPIATIKSFCAGESVILTAPGSYTAHVWNTGATTSSITVATTGTYLVADTNLTSCSIMTDTFHVTATPFVLIPTVTTVSFCAGASVALTVPASYTVYVWNTGATTPSVTETTAGTYWVADKNLTSCIILTDTFNVTEKPVPLVGLGNDTTICLGDFSTLSSPMSEGSFLWSTGSNAPSITVHTGGTYYLTVTSQGCSIGDTITISQLSAPALILGSDTTLCNGDILILKSGTDTTLWSTGVTATSITVTDPGTYSTTITNVCGSSSASINVKFEACDLVFPNAFTPNNDGRNDVARVTGYLSAYKKYTLSIYNRFGQRVFYTEDIYAGWDGTFNNVPQELDTYFYLITYSLKGNHGLLKGDLTLIR